MSLAVAATVANIGQWGGYIAASVLLALTYAMIGAILAPLFGRVAGVLVAFLIPFLDFGIAQDPMLHAAPPTWARFLPGYGSFRILTNSVLTHGLGSPWPLLAALAWLAALTVAAAVAFRHNMGTHTLAHRHVEAVVLPPGSGGRDRRLWPHFVVQVGGVCDVADGEPAEPRHRGTVVQP